MASAWGYSWGSAWGNAWGSIQTVSEEILAGAGIVVRRKHKKYARIDDIIKGSIQEIYAQVTNEESTIKAQAAKIVKPHVKEGAKAAAIPQSAVIDWDALEQDAARVSALLELWQSQMEAQVIAEEEEMLLMLLAA